MRILRIPQPTKVKYHYNTITEFRNYEKLDVSHISSRGESFRLTLPRKIIKKLGLNPDDLIIFGEKDGDIVLRKMKMEE